MESMKVFDECLPESCTASESDRTRKHHVHCPLHRCDTLLTSLQAQRKKRFRSYKRNESLCRDRGHSPMTMVLIFHHVSPVQVLKWLHLE